jgi:ribosomal protein S18 acetylase RimI-like enzyme
MPPPPPLMPINPMDPSKLAIRVATPSDKDAVIANQVASQDAESHLHPSRQKGEAIRGVAWRMVHERHGTMLLAEYDGVVIGHVGGAHAQDTSPFFVPEWQRFALIFDLYVRPEYRRYGVGNALIAAMEAHLKAHGARLVRITVLAGNDAAKTLYSGAGYAPYELMMEKPL